MLYDNVTTCFENYGIKCLCNTNFRMDYFEQMTKQKFKFSFFTVGNVTTFLERIYGRDNLKHPIWSLSVHTTTPEESVMVLRILNVKFCNGCKKEIIGDGIPSSYHTGSLKIVSNNPPSVQYFDNTGRELFQSISKSNNFVATAAYYLYCALSDDEYPLCNLYGKCFCNENYRWNYILSVLKKSFKPKEMSQSKIEDAVHFIYGDKPYFLNITNKENNQYHIVISNLKFRCFKERGSMNILYDQEKCCIQVQFLDVYGNILPTSWFKLFDEYYYIQIGIRKVITPIMLLAFVSHYYYFVFRDFEVGMYCSFFKWINDENSDNIDYNYDTEASNDYKEYGSSDYESSDEIFV